MKPILIVMVGLPGAGKSTEAHELAKRHAPAVIVDYDAIVTALHGGDYGAYSEAMRPVYKAVEHAMVESALANGVNVIVDRCHEKVESRAYWIALARRLELRCYAQLVEVRPSVALARRMCGDARGYDRARWAKIINRRFKLFSAPTVAEGFYAVA